MDIINNKTKQTANSEVQKWFKNCGVIAVILCAFSFLAIYFVYEENTQLKTVIESERAQHIADLKNNTIYIQSLLKSPAK